MSWLKRDVRTGEAGSTALGWVRRDDRGLRSAARDSSGVITIRDYPGNVTSRTIRNDVYQDALRAAESTLRNASKKR